MTGFLQSGVIYRFLRKILIGKAQLHCHKEQNGGAAFVYDHKCRVKRVRFENGRTSKGDSGFIISRRKTQTKNDLSRNK